MENDTFSKAKNIALNNTFIPNGIKSIIKENNETSKKLSSSDLMIGNYLQKDEIIHQILSISGSINDPKKGIKKAATIRTNKSTEYIFLNHFEPILITKDNIKKLGFHKLITSYTIEGTESYNVYFIEKGLVRIRFIGQDIVELKYIHELQNNFYWNTRKKLILNNKK